MAPSSFKKKSFRRPRSVVDPVGVPAKRGRFELDVIEGVQIYSFESKLELDYFSNIEETLPRKTRDFRGFDDGDESLDTIKRRFDDFVQKFSSTGIIKPPSPEKPSLADPEDAVSLVSDSDEAKTAPREQASLDDMDPSRKSGPDMDDEPIQVIEPPTEIITIDSDSDDDVVMVGDPSAPLPKPVRDCLCPTCGKVKRLPEPSPRVVPAKPVSDEVTIIDDDGPAETAPDQSSSTRKDLPPQEKPGQLPPSTPAPPAEICEEVLASCEDVSTPRVEVLAPSEQVLAPAEKVPSPSAAELQLAPSTRSPVKINGVFSLSPSKKSSLTKPLNTGVSSKSKTPQLKPANEHVLLSPDKKHQSQANLSANVPPTIRLVSKESGKTVILKINEANTKIINPSTIPPTNIQAPSKLYDSPQHPQTFHYVIPVEKQRGMNSPKTLTKSVGFHKAGAQMIQQPYDPLRGEKLTGSDDPTRSKHDQGPPSSLMAIRKAQISSAAPGLSSTKPKTSHQAQDPVKYVINQKNIALRKIQKPNEPSQTRERGPPVSGSQQFGKIKVQNDQSRTFCITIPPEGIQVTLPPGFPLQNNASKGPAISGAKSFVQGRKSNVTQSGVALTPVSPKLVVIASPQMKQQATSVGDPQKTNSGSVYLKASSLNKNQSSSIHDSVSSIVGPTEPVVLEDDTKSVVKDLIDFVCRQERFSTSYPYDVERTEQVCLEVPCRQLRCRMGCVCASIAKKNVRRVRCKNPDCIFGCVCTSHRFVLPANRHAKTVPNVKVLCTSRRKQVLTVLQDCDEGGHRATPGFGAPIKSYLPVQKMANKSVPGQVPTAPKAMNGLKVVSDVRGLKTLICSQSSDPVSPAGMIRFTPKIPPSQPRLASNGVQIHPALQTPETPEKDPVTVSVGQSRRYFGREKIPIPDRALMCLTPGLGYVALTETTPRVTLRDPFKLGAFQSFLNVRQATEWLNQNLKSLLKTSSELRWVVADKTTIEKKQLHRLSIDMLQSPNCSISRNGAIFS